MRNKQLRSTAGRRRADAVGRPAAASLTLEPVAAGAGRRRAETSKRKRLVLPVAAICLGLGVAGFAAGKGSYALWRDSATFASATITAGNLDLVRNGPVTWQQVTPGVTTPLSGTLGGTPTDFESMPGDVVEISYPFEVTGKGDNLSAGVSVDYAGGTAPSSSVTTSFHVDNGSGAQIAPATGEASFGDVLDLPYSDPTDAGATVQWTVVVTIHVNGDYQWQSGPSTGTVSTWSAGSFQVSAVQERNAGGAS